MTIPRNKYAGQLRQQIIKSFEGRRIPASGKTAESERYVASVNAKNTSQNCSGCGEKVPETSSVRIHQCSNCGLEICRDLNAAEKIRKRAVGLTVETLTYRNTGSVVSESPTITASVWSESVNRSSVLERLQKLQLVTDWRIKRVIGKQKIDCGD